VNVDMASYKAEFLSKYYKRRLRPPEAYSMGMIMVHARLASKAPRLANALVRAPGLGALLKRVGGISPRRELPPFADETFQAWFARRGTVNPAGDPVVLFPDTFNQFLHPEPMKATVEVLEAAGYRVVVPEQPVCCGRPLYDFGMLSLARRLLHKVLRTLERDIVAGTPVLVLEPSCAAVFRDELPNLLHGDEHARRLSRQTVTLSELLDRHASDWTPPRLERVALVHGHCHHKAVLDFDAEERVIDRLGLDARLLSSGCCGMAGSFGYEHGQPYKLSMAVGERVLLPTIRDADRDALILADGFSCQEQIAHGTGRRPLHLAQALSMAIVEAKPPSGAEAT
jgi:Fe-S oxidoreductase